MNRTRASVGAVLCLAFVLGAAPAFGRSTSTAQLRRGFSSKAKLYAQPITALEGHGQVQVYKKLCDRADQARVCIATTARLRASVTRIARRSGTQITWVVMPVQDGSDFWVLSPIRFNGKDASFRFHYEETAPNGCVSHGSRRFHWSSGAWRLAAGSSVTGCP